MLQTNKIKTISYFDSIFLFSFIRQTYLHWINYFGIINFVNVHTNLNTFLKDQAVKCVMVVQDDVMFVSFQSARVQIRGFGRIFLSSPTPPLLF